MNAILSSPFLLAATVQYHLNQIGTPASTQIKRNIYVDNIITGTQMAAEAIAFYKEAKGIFNEASMNVREWASNDHMFAQSIPEHDRIKCNIVKVLGIEWNTHTDDISVKGTNQTNPVTTKRELLRAIASLFDPLGLFVPALLRGKLLLQDLWRQKKDWDEKLDEANLASISSITNDIRRIPSVTIPRHIGSGDYKLFCFCDASGKAYATTIYLQGSDGCTNLVFAKARVAPVDPISLPRLELLAVQIGVRSIKFVEEQLDQKIVRKYLWTDSQCVLHWLKSTKPLARFVRNRVNEIKKSPNMTYRYVSTNHNPADVASRGASCSELSTPPATWWHGPRWLSSPSDQWPSWNTPELTQDVLQNVEREMKQTSLFEVSNFVAERASAHSSPLGIESKNFSNLTRLLRVTAWALRFINRITRQNQEVNAGPLNSSELGDALNLWLKNAQSTVDTKLITTQLGLKLHDDGLLHCHGRYQNCNLQPETITPVFLPKGTQITKLLISKAHTDSLHAGPTHTLAQLRLRYWVPHGRTIVRSVLANCRMCRRQTEGPYRMPRMVSWPREKVSVSRPFTYTGLDYLGPLYAKIGQHHSQKTWICLFTCIASRAVHLEVVSDLTAVQFLLALRRFVARRGIPSQITLDNAPQFKLTKSATDLAWKHCLRNEDVHSYSASQGITWRFIVEYAPWMGGFYERLVGSVKTTLRKSLGRTCLTMVQLQTVITEAEAVLHSRPLVYVGDDIDAGHVLTPADFLSPGRKWAFPLSEGNMEDDSKLKQKPAEALLQRWKAGQNILDSMWKLWSEQYLLSLRERYRTTLQAPRKQALAEPQLGDVVLIQEKLPRGSWKLGKITRLSQNSEGNVRSAAILMANKRILQRPLSLLIPLECGQLSEDGTSAKDVSENQDKNGVDDPEVIGTAEQKVSDTISQPAQNTNMPKHSDVHNTPSPDRPTRRAAIAARSKLKEWLMT